MKYRRKIFYAFITACSFASLNSNSIQAKEITKITYGNVTDITVAQAPIVAAKELGYFKEEGLDVDIVGFKGTATLLPQMTAKRVDIGYPNPDILIVSRQSGKDHLPLKFFYNMTRTSGWEFAVLDGSPIQSLKDLDGKRLGVGALSWGNVPITKAQFKEIGINVQMVPVGTGAAAFLALKNGEVDALNLFDTQHATLETTGTKIRRLQQDVKYDNLFSNGFIAHEDTIREQPEKLIAFGRAVAKATVFCESNRAACVKLYWKVYPNQKPAGDEEKALKNQVHVFSSRFDKMVSFPNKQRQYGKFDQKQWSDFTNALYEGGQINTKEIDIASCYTNEFVNDISKFDSDAIKSQAKNYKD